MKFRKNKNMDNIPHELHNLTDGDQNYKTVFTYSTPYGSEELKFNGTNYVALCATLRGYTALVNKIPLDFCGGLYASSAFSDIKIPFRTLRTVSNDGGCVLLNIEREKIRRYDFSVIDSKKNSIYSEIRKADSLGFRKQNGLFMLEEERLVKRAVDDKLDVIYMIYTNKSALIADNTVERAKSTGIPCFMINDGLMSALTQTRPVPAEVALCRMPGYGLSELPVNNRSTVLIADNIENPDNLGLIIRTADACGADAVISIGKQASIYHKNCIRASRGAMGRFPVFEYDISEFDMLINQLKKTGYRIYGSSAKTTLTVHNTDAVPLRAFVVSNETYGISDYMLNAADEMIKIPMATGQSSFNVAVAAGIILSGALHF